MLPTRMPKARRPKEKRDEDEDAAANAGPVGHRHGRRADIARDRTGIAAARGIRQPGRDSRSEEHTSELQSLMRISYAVFCLKKKSTTVYNKQHPHIHNHSSNQQT